MSLKNVSHFEPGCYIQIIRILDSRKCLERREGVEVSVGTGYLRYKRVD